jgi:hypothetical protein
VVVPHYLQARHAESFLSALGAVTKLSAPDAVHVNAPAEGAMPRGRIVVPADAGQAGADAAVYGPGLAALLDLVATRMPKAEVEAVWAFPGVRRDEREHGVAVVERRGAGERRLVYRGRWSVQVKGQERGRIEVSLEETAEAHPETVLRVLEGVRRRADEAGDAEPVALGPWRGGGGDG